MTTLTFLLSEFRNSLFVWNNLFFCTASFPQKKYFIYYVWLLSLRESRKSPSDWCHGPKGATCTDVNKQPKHQPEQSWKLNTEFWKVRRSDNVWGSFFLTLNDKIKNKGCKKWNLVEYQAGIVKASPYFNVDKLIYGAKRQEALLPFPKEHYFINLIQLVIDVTAFEPCPEGYWSLAVERFLQRA